MSGIDVVKDTKAAAFREYTEAASEHALTAGEIRRVCGRPYMKCTDRDFRDFPDLFRKYRRTHKRYTEAIAGVNRFGGFLRGERTGRTAH